MIELIYLETGLYIKKRLTQAYDNHLESIEPWVTTFSYPRFVEQAFTAAINWYCCDMQQDDTGLAIINFDTEFAEDLLDSISGLTISELEDWSVKFTVEYLENINAIIVRSSKIPNELILPDPANYAQSYAKMRTTQLTKIARLLNELRASKNG